MGSKYYLINSKKMKNRWLVDVSIGIGTSDYTKCNFMYLKNIQLLILTSEKLCLLFILSIKYWILGDKI